MVYDNNLYTIFKDYIMTKFIMAKLGIIDCRLLMKIKGFKYPAMLSTKLVDLPMKTGF